MAAAPVPASADGAGPASVYHLLRQVGPGGQVQLPENLQRSFQVFDHLGVAAQPFVSAAELEQAQSVMTERTVFFEDRQGALQALDGQPPLALPGVGVPENAVAVGLSANVAEFPAELDPAMAQLDRTIVLPGKHARKCKSMQGSQLVRGGAEIQGDRDSGFGHAHRLAGVAARPAKATAQHAQVQELGQS